MRRPVVRLVSVCAPGFASLLLACGDPAGVGRSDVLRVRVVGPTIVLTTDDAEPVHYFAIDRAAAALIDWAPCTDPATCPSVSRGVPVRIPFSSLGSEVEGGGREAIIYHWQLEEDGSGSYRVDSVRSIVVSLRARLPAFAAAIRARS